MTELTDVSFTKFWLAAAAAQQRLWFPPAADLASEALRSAWLANVAAQRSLLRMVMRSMSGGWAAVPDQDCDETPSQAALHPELIAL